MIASMFEFCTLASGSSGNSVFVSGDGVKILIDVGLSGRTIELALKSIGKDCSDINAIFVTHDHSDHVKGAGILSRRFNIPIFATEGTWQGIGQACGKIDSKNKRYVYKNEEVQLNGIRIIPFSIPHDTADPVGYSVFCGDVKASIATDIGYASDMVLENMLHADILMLESNHDVEMLKNGRYTYHQKKRILSEVGHLSNVGAGTLLKDAFSQKLKHVILGHLSAENNTPLLAYETVFTILESNGIPVNKAFKLHLAPRSGTGQMITLDTENYE